MMETTLVFMAAGFGSRFGGGVKQIEPVGPCGEVLMEYAAHDAIKAGFNRVVLIIRRDLEAQFRDGVGKRLSRHCDVRYVFQDLNDLPTGFVLPKGRVKPWGTAQAVLTCRGVVNTPFCVLNADDYYGAQAFELIHDYLMRDNGHGALDGCMAGYVLGNTVSPAGAVTRGICCADDSGRLMRVKETRGIVLRDGKPYIEPEGKFAQSDALVSMNIWGFYPAFIDYLAEGFTPFLNSLGDDALTKEYLLPEAIAGMINKGLGCVRVLPTSDHWFGMTYQQDKAETQRRIRELIGEGRYPGQL